jgi:hypothetical protein
MLPQDHVFNPHLPKTPKLPRAPRRNESFFSANGSPVALDEGSDGNDEDEDEEEDDGAASDASDASDELPDPEEMERRALGRTGSQKSTKSVKSTTSTKSTKSVASGTSKSSRSTRKVKRAPSLLFRQAASGAEDDDDEADISSSPDGTARIALSDGREIEFDPINIDAARIDAELEEGGLDEDEKHRVKARVQEEAMRTLAARMAAWKALK